MAAEESPWIYEEGPRHGKRWRNRESKKLTYTEPSEVRRNREDKAMDTEKLVNNSVQTGLREAVLGLHEVLRDPQVRARGDDAEVERVLGYLPSLNRESLEWLHDRINGGKAAWPGGKSDDVLRQQIAASVRTMAAGEYGPLADHAASREMYDRTKRGLEYPGAEVVRQPGTQYGGQPSVEVRRNGVFYFNISDAVANQLETNGYIDQNGKPTAKVRPATPSAAGPVAETVGTMTVNGQEHALRVQANPGGTWTAIGPHESSDWPSREKAVTHLKFVFANPGVPVTWHDKPAETGRPATADKARKLDTGGYLYKGHEIHKGNEVYPTWRVRGSRESDAVRLKGERYASRKEAMRAIDEAVKANGHHGPHTHPDDEE